MEALLPEGLEMNKDLAVAMEAHQVPVQAAVHPIQPLIQVMVMADPLPIVMGMTIPIL